MRQISTYIFIILLFSQWLNTKHALSQDNKLRNTISSYSEKCQLVTDRSLYISGENIFFSAYVFFGSNNEPTILSKVLYIEIIDPKGNSIANSKNILNNGKSNGFIEIPENTLSGVYYIKSYTKWMRNYTYTNYCYTPIKIINPHIAEIKSIGIIDTLSIKTNLSSIQVKDFKEVEISLPEYSIKPRDSIKLKISLIDDIELPNITLSIIPEATLSLANNFTLNHQNQNSLNKFIPETRGLSISGQLINKETRVPLKGERINFSIANHYNFFNSNYTDSLGKFYFSLPNLKGLNEISIGTESSLSNNILIIIDPDFSNDQSIIPTAEFSLTNEEKTIALQMANNQLISKNYTKINSPIIIDSINNLKNTFYKSPNFTINFDEYVSLPSISEYFHEFIPSIIIAKKEGKRSIYFSKNQQKFVQAPLILLDGIAITDIDKLLNIQPNLIKKIEIINSIYYCGSMVYGGLVSAFSRESNFAGFEFDQKYNFFNFQFLHTDLANNTPIQNLKNEPIVKNTLLWNPDLKLIQQKKYITFISPDNPGKYIVVISGIARNGDIITKKIPFEVLDK
ncbi:MAG: hypothetical protein AB9846_01060 [Tenuifilaceae bacterium]